MSKDTSVSKNGSGGRGETATVIRTHHDHFRITYDRVCEWESENNLHF